MIFYGGLCCLRVILEKFDQSFTRTIVTRCSERNAPVLFSERDFVDTWDSDRGLRFDKFFAIVAAREREVMLIYDLWGS